MLRQVRYCELERCLYAHMITLLWHARRWRRVLLLRLFIFRGDSIKDALACVLSFGPFRRINFTTRPLLSQTRTHSSTNPIEWVRTKRRTTTKTKTVVSEASKVEGLTSGWCGMLTVYVIQTTADAMSKHDIARRQNGPVKKLILLLVDRRYKENKTRTCTSKTLHMMILTR